MRIDEEEEMTLRTLYEEANDTDTDESWQNVRSFYDKLGRKYNFDPKRVMINTRGEVTKRAYESIYVVYNSALGEPIASYRSKRDALEHTMQDMKYHWKEIGLN